MDYQKLFNYLKRLSENNNREWFNENKAEFNELKVEFENYIQFLIPKIYEIDPSVGNIEAKNCIFRIYRDVRFSKNKAPYKTHFGAYIASGGRKSRTCGYYIHIEPNEMFIAAGAYAPEPNILKEIRYEIMDHPDEFKKILNNKSFTKYFSGIVGEKLKTIPKGFPKDFEDIELLRYKSFEVFHPIGKEKVLSNNIDKYILDIVAASVPYNQFFNKVIEHVLNEEND